MAKKMSTGTKAMIGIAVVGAAAGLGYFLWKRKKASDFIITPQSVGPQPGPSTALPKFGFGG